MNDYIRVWCRTNVDWLKRDEWPTQLAGVPRVGQLVQSKTGMRARIVQVCWRTDGGLELEVTNV